MANLLQEDFVIQVNVIALFELKSYYVSLFSTSKATRYIFKVINREFGKIPHRIFELCVTS